MNLRTLLCLGSAALLLGAAPLSAAYESPELYRGVVPRREEGSRRLDGLVVLVATVDRDGKVVDLYVKSASHPELVEPATTAMWSWQYTPAHRDHRPVQAKVEQRFVFGDGPQG